MAGLEIVGRESELAVAGGFLDAARQRSCALVVEGEAGIGKTAVWGAVVEQALAQGHRVLRCQAEQAEARLSFVGLGDLLGDIPRKALQSLPGPQRDALEVALLREPARGRRPDPRTVSVALKSLLAHLARRGPVLIAVDDLQWLDAPTARALAFAARRLDHEPVGLLATVRSPLTVPDPLGLEHALGPDRLTQLRLGPLSLAALRRLLEVHLERTYPRPTLVRIVEASGGNPLFALEIARALGSDATLDPGAPLPVPDSLRELVADRVDAVGGAARDALLAAAALSQPTVEIVERMSSSAGLAAAEEAGLVRLHGNRIEFAHPLYASAVYGVTATRRRRQLHRRLAGLVADPEERARHLALSTEGPNEKVAAELTDAAGLATERGALSAAAELLERARSLTPADEELLRYERAIAAATCHVRAADYTSTRAMLEETLTDLGSGPRRALALRLLAEAHYYGDSWVEAARLLEEALSQTGEEAAIRMPILLGFAFLKVCFADVPAAAAHATEALALGERLGEPGALAEALAVKVIVDLLLGRGLDDAGLDRAVALEDPTRHTTLVFRPSYIHALVLLWTGRLEESRASFDELRAQMREKGEELELQLTAFQRTWLDVWLGNLDGAARATDEAVAIAAELGTRSALGLALAARSLVRAHQGELEACRADAQEALKLLEEVGFRSGILWPLWSLGLTALCGGRPEEVVSTLAPMGELWLEAGFGDPSMTPFAPDLVEALIALGQLERAEALASWLESRGAELDRTWAVAVGARCRGLILAAQGRLDDAATSLARALAEHERVPTPIDHGRTLLALGRVERRRRQKRRAREALEQALELFDRTGARHFAEQTRAELDRLGLRRAPADLTPTEQRVAELAATGLTNREVAAALFVSPKTVQANLARIYRKLGIASRAELGGAMALRAPRQNGQEPLQT